MYDGFFKTLGPVGCPFAINQGSRRVLEDNGFQLEGIRRSSVWKNGRLLDSCMYALLREEN